MIIVRLFGGLGNQMFQYAAARRLAYKHNTSLKLDIVPLTKSGYRSYGLYCFNVKEDFVRIKDIFRIYPVEGFKRIVSNILGDKLSDVLFTRVIKDRKSSLAQRYYNYDPASEEISDLVVSNILSQRFFHFDPEVLDAPDNMYMMGSWISEKYFKDIEDIIRKEFTFKSSQTEKNKELTEMIRNTESVSIHIRRGDYVAVPENTAIYNCCGPGYYTQCLKYITDKVKFPHFFIFSDDIEWAKKNLEIPFPATFVDHNDDLINYEDMRLMSQCKHNIIANSSFSWWGAWLNPNPGKIVCAPAEFIKLWNFDSKDVLPREWLKFSNDCKNI